MAKPTFFQRVTEVVLGRPLAAREQAEQQIGVLGGIPTLGLDSLSSAAYGPEAALTILLPLGALGLRYEAPIVGVICVLLAILFFSYRQTIGAYPSGGGSYIVAKTNLGDVPGLVAAAALMLDYTLNVCVGISAGIEALVSALPRLHPYMLPLCLVVLALITLVNLRGVGESGKLFSLPTYGFVATLFIALAWGAWKTLHAGGHPVPIVHPAPLPRAATAVSLWLLLRAFAAGCTAMTGVEAVSNGVMAFKEPRQRNAEVTLTAIVAVLMVLLVGVTYVGHGYHVGAMDQNAKDYQSVLSQIVAAVAGRGAFYYVTLACVLAVLCLSANTSFAGFPRLCHLVAEDDYMPHGFANVGRRLVYSIGILILAGLSAVILIIFRGITDALIPLFAVGAFLAFTLSQAGMVAHWRRALQPGGTPPAPSPSPSDAASGAAAPAPPPAPPSPALARVYGAINALGAVTTGIALVIIVAAKFVEGAWITVLVIPGLVWVFLRVKRHYEHVDHETRVDAPMVPGVVAEPIVVMPIHAWNSVAEKALRFALRLSSHIEVLYVASDERGEKALREQWAAQVEAPLTQAGQAVPRLVVLSSPYRLLYKPLDDYIEGLKREHPDCFITVLVPELVETRWYDYLLHNHRAMRLKYELLFDADPHVVVLNVPWHLGEPPKRK